MAHRLSRRLLAVFVLLLAASIGATQPAGLPNIPLPANLTPPPKSAEPAPAAKELSAQEIDALIEKAFGKDSRELKQSVRLWFPSLGVLLSAEKATVAGNERSVRFDSAAVALSGKSGDLHLIRPCSVLVFTEPPTLTVADLRARSVTCVEIETADVRIKVVGFFTANHPVGMDQPSGIRLEFKHKIPPKASLKDLLPTPVKSSAKLPLWTNEDLAKVRELTFGEPISKKLPKHKAMETTAHVMAKINHLNGKKTDGFMLAMIEQRKDLRGLPFRMGDDCRTREQEARLFARTADAVRFVLQRAKVDAGDIDAFWSKMGESNNVAQMEPTGARKGNDLRVSPEQMLRAKIAALMQILMPEPAEIRIGLAKFLATVSHKDATKALARLAIFSPEDEVRAAAIEGLKLRREKDYTDVLMQGFRYPLPAVSKRAAEALVKLERKDLLVNLIEVLESPDPRLPIQARSASKGFIVRELVKVNHHRNCLLCHAPGNTDNTPEGVLKVAVPLPGEPLPNPSEGGGYQSTPPPSPDIVVRLDMTYLRQDFSVMMPVSDAHPWPEMQRFDFLVRIRELTAAEAKAYVEDKEPGRLSPYHRSALYALREMTGRDTEPTAAAWRKLLKLSK